MSEIETIKKQFKNLYIEINLMIKNYPLIIVSILFSLVIVQQRHIEDNNNKLITFKFSTKDKIQNNKILKLEDKSKYFEAKFQKVILEQEKAKNERKLITLKNEEQDEKLKKHNERLLLLENEMATLKHVNQKISDLKETINSHEEEILHIKNIEYINVAKLKNLENEVDSLENDIELLNDFKNITNNNVEFLKEEYTELVKKFEENEKRTKNSIEGIRKYLSSFPDKKNRIVGNFKEIHSSGIKIASKIEKTQKEIEDKEYKIKDCDRIIKKYEDSLLMD